MMRANASSGQIFTLRSLDGGWMLWVSDGVAGGEGLHPYGWNRRPSCLLCLIIGRSRFRTYRSSKSVSNKVSCSARCRSISCSRRSIVNVTWP
jgi:hypothetical protein